MHALSEHCYAGLFHLRSLRHCYDETTQEFRKRHWVELATNGRRIRLTITDDGLGFDLNHAEAGLGLISMRQRVVSVGGTIDITSAPNAGTEIEVWVPLRIDDIPSVA